MNEPNWTDAVSSIGIWATPIVVAFFGWLLNRKWNRDEQKRKKDEQLHPDRLEVYNKCMEPFVLALMAGNDRQAQGRKTRRKIDHVDQAVKTVLSVEYRKNACMLMLIGSDTVVRSFNEMFQSFCSMEAENTDVDARSSLDSIEKLGTLILEIRKSVGDESTELESLDMVHQGSQGDPCRSRMSALHG
ncbi:MAG: hypothetical protein F4Z42_01545 [Holophagales bacterium]|nr:hypothetical protein [Holophagales bacterium]